MTQRRKDAASKGFKISLLVTGVIHALIPTSQEGFLGKLGKTVGKEAKNLSESGSGFLRHYGRRFTNMGLGA